MEWNHPTKMKTRYRALYGSSPKKEPITLHEAYAKLCALENALPDTDDAVRDAFAEILREMPNTATMCVVTGLGESGHYTAKQFLSFVQGKRGKELVKLIEYFTCEVYMEANYGS
jgi:hypothetical protein